MSEYVSVVATTHGPFALYAAPGLSSHGKARAGWKITGGAEVEWTGESHDYLSVRHEENAVANTIKAMLVERYPNRAAMLAAITETRGEGGVVAFYRNGQRVFTEAEAGPNVDELNNLIAKLPTLPYFEPTEECCDEILEQLVAQHLCALGTYCKDARQFDHVTLKIVREPAARDAAWAAAWAAARDAAWAAAWAAARNAARDAAWDAARAAAHIIADLPNNPWAPLVEIWALGAVPIGVVEDEFVVYVPER